MPPEPTPNAADAIRAGRDALGRAAWDEARERFAAAVELGAGAEAHEGLATSAYYLEDVDTMLTAHERAYALYRGAGERAAAARMALGMVIDIADFRPDAAVANGWLQKAARMLDGLPPSPEHGLLAGLRGHMALMGDRDLTRARAYAKEALDIARLTNDPVTEMLSLATRGSGDGERRRRRARDAAARRGHGVGALPRGARSQPVRDHVLLPDPRVRGGPRLRPRPRMVRPRARVLPELAADHPVHDLPHPVRLGADGAGPVGRG